LGEDPEQRLSRYGLNGSTWSYMWISPWQDDSLFHATVDLVQTSQPFGSLGRRAAELGEMGRNQALAEDSAGRSPNPR
jgi:hypothetical protein